MDWCSTILGAAIGFVSSIGIIVVQRLIDRAGKIEIFAKIVYDITTGSQTWGFQQNADGLYLNVPIWLEIHNLSNSTRLLRDINLVLMSKGKELATMIQSNRAEIPRKGEYLFANKGSYSLSIGGGIIEKLDCFFMLKASSDIACFDEIMLRYYDEKDRIHKYSLGHFDGDWHEKEFPRNGDWMKLREEK